MYVLYLLIGSMFAVVDEARLGDKAGNLIVQDGDPPVRLVEEASKFPVDIAPDYITSHPFRE